MPDLTVEELAYLFQPEIRAEIENVASLPDPVLPGDDLIPRIVEPDDDDVNQDNVRDDEDDFNERGLRYEELEPVVRQGGYHERMLHTLNRPEAKPDLPRPGAEAYRIRSLKMLERHFPKVGYVQWWQQGHDHPAFVFLSPRSLVALKRDGSCWVTLVPGLPEPGGDAPFAYFVLASSSDGMGELPEVGAWTTFKRDEDDELTLYHCRERVLALPLSMRVAGEAVTLLRHLGGPRLGVDQRWCFELALDGDGALSMRSVGEVAAAVLEHPEEINPYLGTRLRDYGWRGVRHPQQRFVDSAYRGLHESRRPKFVGTYVAEIPQRELQPRRRPRRQARHREQAPSRRELQTDLLIRLVRESGQVPLQRARSLYAARVAPAESKKSFYRALDAAVAQGAIERFVEAGVEHLRVAA